MNTSSPTTVTWYGHSNFQIYANGVSVLIDPFFTHNPSCKISWDAIPKPDLVLVTHDHGDHVGDAIAICKATGAMCGCIVGTGQRLIESGMPQQCIPAGIGYNIGGTFEEKGIKATMTEAFHSTESGANTGFIVTMPNGFTFYHAGDTGIFCNMEFLGKLYPLDLALLPIGGYFTMDGYQAAHAAKLLNPKAVIPMHWGTFPVLAQDISGFTGYLGKLAPTCRLVAMQPGETCSL